MIVRRILCLALVTWTTQGTSISSMVQVACQRDPSLPYCTTSDFDPVRKFIAQPNAADKTEKARALSSPLLTVSERNQIIELAAAVKRFKRNPFTDDETGHDGPTNLRQKSSDPQEEGFILEKDESRGKLREKELVELEPFDEGGDRKSVEDTEENEFRGGREEYCEKYEQHFAYFCIGEQSDGRYEEVTSQFCPSYKKACPNKSVTSSVPQTAWPSDPFESPARHTVTRPRVRSVEESSEEDYEETEDEVYNAELKRRFPCKPDCDRRLFPHCTAECKCDYSYPAVQKFCNPPPMPLFLNTCRLWYNGCPKYQRYHYASQFVYSKAEKGKVLPGQTNPNPYNIPSPGLTRQAAARHSRRGGSSPLIPLAMGSTTLGIPPDLPDNYRSTERDERGKHHHRPSHHHHLHHRRRRRYEEGRGQHTSHHSMTSSSLPSRRELIRNLRAINSRTKSPVGHVTSRAHHGGNRGSAAPRARAHAAFPVVASDAAYGASGGSEDPFKSFDGLTDSRGILHRPHSSSPFTKPGLWEPNPDDPHSRDPANKYYYHPESVGVDWLNGQMTWGSHWAVPAAGVGGTDGFSAIHFPTIGTFLNIPDDYD